MTLTTLDATSALVVIDLQRAILERATVPTSPAQVLERCATLANGFRALDRPVVLVRVSFAHDGKDVVPGRTESPRSMAGYAPGWDEIAAELSGHDGDVVITKRNWSAFYGTDLDLQLRRRGVTQVFLAGIATSAGVESTARAAHEHGYHVGLVVDAMADADLDAHEHSVRRIFPRLGETTTSIELLELLGRVDPGKFER